MADHKIQLHRHPSPPAQRNTNATPIVMKRQKHQPFIIITHFPVTTTARS